MTRLQGSLLTELAHPLRRGPIDDFTAVEVVHDIRNILAGVKLFSEIARRELLGESPVSDAVNHIQAGCDQAGRLCGLLLDRKPARIATRPQVDFSLLVQQMQPALSALVSPSVLQIDLASHIAAVDAEPDAISRVVTNLVLNAVQSFDNRQGMVTICTGAGSEKDRDGLVFLEVADNGCGMDEATQHKLFDSGFTTKQAGHGLGMASVLRLVTENGGMVQVRSRLGVGTTVRVSFPLADSSMLDRANGLPSITLCSQNSILVVDDDRGIQLASKVLLESRGWNVLTARSGHAAVELYRARSDEIAVVLLDVSLPGMDGVEVLRQMRLIDPHMRAIVLSGYDERTVLDRFRDDHPDGFLSKPFSIDDVAAKLHDMLRDDLSLRTVASKLSAEANHSNHREMQVSK